MSRQQTKGATPAPVPDAARGARNSPVAARDGKPPAFSGREFPDFPRVGVGGVVVDNGYVLLIRRGQQPLKGKWSLPGGLVEVGENLLDAVRREIKEETGLDVEPLRLIGVFERILLSQRGSPRLRRVRYHYVLIDYACRLASAPRAGRRLRPASDVTEARWVPPEKLREYRLTAQAHAVILEALQLLSAAR